VATRTEPAGTGPLRILLLGGFEAWHRGERVRGFESQKVRALLAYLLLHRGRALARDRLAALFWGGMGEESARRNLRQALYNLKATLPGEDSGRPQLVADGQEVRFEPAPDLWLDVDAFERALGLANATSRADATGFQNLVGAVALYRGDLLAGFQVRDCPEFEEWLVTEQERLREAALEALRVLVAGYLARGEHRLGIPFARRLVAMDPLAEGAHRQLLRLYELAGHRERALTHYTDLRELLRRELGVEPLPETRKLHDGILSAALHDENADAPPETTGPIVPLVGRRESWERLAATWQAVLDGRARTTLLAGEEGIGKTRLARSFLDAATAHRNARVLVGAALDREPQPTGGPFAEALRQALPEEESAPDPLAGLPAPTRRALARLLPELAAKGAPAGATDHPLPPGALADAVATLLRLLARGDDGAAVDPVILLLDDLHRADPATLALVEELPARLGDVPVWVIATFEPDATADDHPLWRLAVRSGESEVEVIALERLERSALAEIATLLVEEGEAAGFAALLERASAGLPLALVTLVNSMWDEGELVAESAGRWRFRGSPSLWEARAGEGLDRLLLRRVRRLPASTRRLATMAAILGQRFDTGLLVRAEEEHASVVEVALEILLERWLVRPQRERWHPAGLASSGALWSRGARRGRFEFDHPRVRAALYRELNPLRRQALHGQAAAALAALHRDDPATVAEELAHHALEAGQWERAYPALLHAGERARAAGDAAGEQLALTRAQQVLDRLLREAGEGADRERWQAERARFAAS
jgi:DNA-binding SARP family transcriptional activator